MTTQSQGTTIPQNNLPAKPVESASERFTKMIVKEFSGGVGEIALTNFQKRLCQSYFMVIDSALKMAEEKRMKKEENKRDKLPVTWQNVNMELLSRKVVGYARMGLDAAMKNHINIIPFKDNTANKYNMTFIEGYKGMEIVANKYGLNIPDSTTIEVVYSTDKFIPIKKDIKNPSDSYLFEITKPFDRGEIIGGFYFHEYLSNPSKNKLMFYSLAEIEKRKPEYASVEFWGGEKPKWETGENGKSKKVGTEKVEGWLAEMVYKTLARAAYGSITIDSQKIDDDYLVLLYNEQEKTKELSPSEEVKNNANKEPLHFDEAEVITEPSKATKQSETTGKAPEVNPTQNTSKASQQEMNLETPNQPGF